MFDELKLNEEMHKKILMIDDDADDAQIFEEALSEMDASLAFYRAWDGQEALDILFQNKIENPDIIFLDVNMPGMNGWQFLKLIKEEESYKHIPVIVYSTASLQREADIAKDLGAACFLTKPNDFKDVKMIARMVVKYLNEDFPKLIEWCNEVQFQKPT